MKKLTALILAAVMLLSLTACGAEKSTAAEETAAAFTPALATDTEGTIYFVGSWGNFEALDSVAADFKEYYPNVNIVYIKLDDYRNDLANRFATGEEIDLFMCDWWDVEYPANANIIANAEDLNSAGIDFSNIDAELLSTGLADGAQMMVPLYLMMWGYAVNLDLFKAAGAEVPTDLSGLYTACEKLAAAGCTQPIYVNSSHYGRTFIGYFMEQTASASDDMAALDATLARMNEVTGSGYVSFEGDTLEDSYNAMILRFFEGDVPMMSISTNNFSGTAKREAKSESFTANPFEYTFIPAVLSESGSAYVDQLNSVYVGVYRNSPNLELANEFLRFMLTDEEMLVLQQVKNMPTSNANNGFDSFPYLQSAQLFNVTAEGMYSLNEEYGLNTLSAYKSDDSSAMYEKMEAYLADGLK